MSELDGEAKNQKALALQEKKGGDDAYENKDFDAAVKHYTKAMELDDEDISYVISRSSVYYKMGKYNECIEDCKNAVKRGLELNSNVELLARAFFIKGLALAKMAQSAKDYDFAIEAFKMALTKHRNSDILEELEEVEQLKQLYEQKECIVATIADEERESGNDCYRSQDYHKSVKHYTEAIKLNPNDAKVYSNRAACYIKLAALPAGLMDANKCLELDASFARGYVRKGAIQFLMEEYNAALETYETGLKHDENNKELLEGISKCRAQILKANRDTVDNVGLKERQANAMLDPEIQSILADPILRQVLMDIQGNPRDAHEQVKNPLVWKKLEKLMEAGII